MLRITICALLVTMVVSQEVITSLVNHWNVFKAKHNKNYDEDTEQQRKEYFKDNVEACFEHNIEADLGLKSYTLGLNAFADMSNEEFRATYLGLRYDDSALNDTDGLLAEDEPMGDVPESKDWLTFVTPVKNQKSCGSCWAYATTGSVEAHVAIYQNKRVSLSEQNLVDCSGRAYGNYGCSGGLPDNAYRYIIQNGGLDSDTCYPYEMKETTCRYDPACNTATITGFKHLARGNEKNLLDALANKGPVAIGIDAGQRDFQLFKTGVYDNAMCKDRPNHAVLAVGYGVENGKQYYLVKNSWGTSWGDQGYFKLARGKNRCGVSNLASYPIVQSM